MLSHAGVDVIFFDCTNNCYIFVEPLKVVVEAFRDSKATGLNVPKISFLATIVMPNNYSFHQPASIYMSCFVENDYSDLWYYLDGKPMFIGDGRYLDAENNVMHREMQNFFTFRPGVAPYDDNIRRTDEERAGC